MSRLAIFTAPKPFTDAHINTIQRNAITSWREMGTDVEVLLLGEEAGMGTAAKDLGVRHIPKVRRNAHGTPLVSALFEAARGASDAPVLAYVNADILLLPETPVLVDAARSQAEQFVLMGRRHDLDVQERLDFSGEWAEELRATVRARGYLHPPGGSDYFIFPRELYREIPDLVIGRAGWDNWMIHEAVRQPWLAVDATLSLLAIHQNHDYAHLPKGDAHYRHAETEENTRLAGGMRNMYSLLDVKHELRDGAIRRVGANLPRLVRRAEHWLQPDARAGSGWRWALLRRLRRWRRNLLGMEEG